MRAKNLPPGVRYLFDAQGRDRIEVRMKFRRADGTLADVSRLLPPGGSLGDAKALQRRLVAEASGGEVKLVRQSSRSIGRVDRELTIGEAFEKYIAACAHNRTIDKKRVLVLRLAQTFGPSLPISSLTRRRVSEYCDARIAAGKKAQTVNNELRTIKHMAKVGADKGWLLDALETDIKRAPLAQKAKGEGRRRRICTAAERRALLRLDAYPERLADLHPLVFVAFHTACRASELRLLTKSQIDLVAGTITWDMTKNGREDVKPIHPAALPVLRAAIKRSPSAWVFPSYSGKGEGARPYHSTTLSHMFAALVEALGFGADARGERIVMHSIRHSVLTLLGEHATDSNAAMEMANHSDATMTRHYQHVALERKRAALAQLPDLAGDDALH